MKQRRRRCRAEGPSAAIFDCCSAGGRGQIICRIPLSVNMRCDFCECHVDKLYNCGDYDLCFHCMEEVQSWFDELIFWEEE